MGIRVVRKGSNPVLEANFKQMKFTFSLDGKTPDANNLATFDFPNQGQLCRVVSYLVTDWPAGEHHLTTTLTFLKKINDGFMAAIKELLPTITRFI